MSAGQELLQWLPQVGTSLLREPGLRPCGQVSAALRIRKASSNKMSD
jgi:hypothetical protein